MMSPMEVRGRNSLKPGGFDVCSQVAQLGQMYSSDVAGAIETAALSMPDFPAQEVGESQCICRSVFTLYYARCNLCLQVLHTCVCVCAVQY